TSEFPKEDLLELRHLDERHPGRPEAPRQDVPREVLGRDPQTVSAQKLPEAAPGPDAEPRGGQQGDLVQPPAQAPIGTGDEPRSPRAGEAGVVASQAPELGGHLIGVRTPERAIVIDLDRRDLADMTNASAVGRGA